MDQNAILNLSRNEQEIVNSEFDMHVSSMESTRLGQ